MYIFIVTKHPEAERFGFFTVHRNVVDVETFLSSKSRVLKHLGPDSRVGLHEAHLVGKDMQFRHRSHDERDPFSEGIYQTQ